MAEQLKPNGSENVSEGPQHNARAREEQIKDALEATYQADRQIAVAIERHVQQYRDAKAHIKKVLRDDLNISAQLFSARYASYKLEREAIAAGDDATLDVLRELHEMAPVGAQVSMLDALEGREQPDAAA